MSKTRSHSSRRFQLLAVSLMAVCGWAFWASGSALASKQVIDYFGTFANAGSKGGEFDFQQNKFAYNDFADVAINESGAGAGDPGDVYVTDQAHNRVQRFGRDDAGTPATASDDSYFFISAWGADVDATPLGGSDYEICTVAPDCQAAKGSGGNGSAAGNGALSEPTGIAVDQDSGEVYVVDAINARINVYDGDGTFLRSFGRDVVASGPDNVSAPAERQELTVKADGGKFSLAFKELDFKQVATAARGRGTRIEGSTLVSGFKALTGTFKIGDSVSGLGIQPDTTITAFGTGSLTLSKPATGFVQGDPFFGDSGLLFVDDLAHDASAAEVEAAINGLSTIGGVGGSVTVTGGPGDDSGSAPYMIEFGGALAEEDVPPLVATSGGLSLDSGAGSAIVTEVTKGGAYEVCEAANGDVCRAGTTGASSGEFGQPSRTKTSGFEETYRLKGIPYDIAVSPPDGDSDNGAVFVSDAGNHRINTYALDGSSPASIGGDVFAFDSPRNLAIDSRGIIYASGSTSAVENQGIQRYDSENANGGGVGFLSPIASAIEVQGGPGDASGSQPYTISFSGPLGHKDVSQLTVEDGAIPLSGGLGATVTTTTQGGPGNNEIQRVKVAATDGQFKLDFDGASTGATGTGTTQSGSKTITNVTTSTGTFIPGEALIGTNIPADARVQQVSAGTIKFEAPSGATASGPVSDLSADLAYNTSSSVMKSALRALSSVPASLEVNGQNGLAIDLDSDGPGPDTDVLYEMSATVASAIRQFGPVNRPGLTTPPAEADEEHGQLADLSYNLGPSLAAEESTGRLYAPRFWFGGPTGFEAHGVYVLGDVGPAPTATLNSVTDVTATTATVNATIDPNGPPTLSYHLEYSTDGTTWKSAPSVVLGSQEDPQEVSAVLDPPGAGLDPGTLYHVRLVAVRRFAEPVTTGEQTFTTLASAPLAETVGSPQRSATTARLEGRINPRGTASTYHFEYGSEGPCAASPCTSTAPAPAGAGLVEKLASALVEGLKPGTTYHYRVVVESSASGSPVYGQDMTVTTRTSDAPLEHGHLPGPAGSDRAYEQVSLPDSSGNPVASAVGFSADGSRALYSVAGGSPSSDVGTGANVLFAERDSGGWHSRQFSPPRDELLGRIWDAPSATSDLSVALMPNFEELDSDTVLWRLSPGGDRDKLYAATAPQVFEVGNYALSANGSLAVAMLRGGTVDPSFPSASQTNNLYDISSGAPHLLSLLPGNTVSSCGIDKPPPQQTHWISADGSRLFFSSRGTECDGGSQLYVREVASGQSKLISRPALSGKSCGSRFLRSTPGSVFFQTQARLDPQDTLSPSCSGSTDSDVYRYDLGDEGLDCVTCVVDGLPADVTRAAVADDGSRVYFNAQPALLPGTAPGGAYRVAIGSGDLAYVGTGAVASDSGAEGAALSPDGSVLVFRSSEAALNPLGGTSNGGTFQYYRYDDRDRSLVCLSCSQDGTPPEASVPQILTRLDRPELGLTGLARDGGTFAFVSPNSLLNADQNTPGPGQDPESGEDVYEWRDGRLLLVTDGLTNWAPESQPRVAGISSSGRDIYFTVAAQYTQDALDGYNRLYDARIGGGFEFPPPPKPCPLEVCQGTPKGAPAEQEPASSNFQGLANRTPSGQPRPRCSKGKRKVRRNGKTRCVKPQRKHQRPKRAANTDRRASR